MKKMLSILGTVGITVSSSLPVIACGDKAKVVTVESIILDFNEIIKFEFELEKGIDYEKNAKEVIVRNIIEKNPNIKTLFTRVTTSFLAASDNVVSLEFSSKDHSILTKTIKKDFIMFPYSLEKINDFKKEFEQFKNDIVLNGINYSNEELIKTIKEKENDFNELAKTHLYYNGEEIFSHLMGYDTETLIKVVGTSNNFNATLFDESIKIYFKRDTKSFVDILKEMVYDENIIENVKDQFNKNIFNKFNNFIPDSVYELKEKTITLKKDFFRLDEDIKIEIKDQA